MGHGGCHYDCYGMEKKTPSLYGVAPYWWLVLRSSVGENKDTKNAVMVMVMRCSTQQYVCD